jgi:hypothetical protein
MSQEEDDTLDALWRSATAADAERPAAQTRTAILADAAAAARRRAPAANAPRYWMRVAAGVAVVGVGLMLWRQTEAPLPGEMPVAAPMMQERLPEADAVAAPTPAPTQAFDNAASENAPRAQAPLPAPPPELRSRAEESERQEMKLAQQSAPAGTGAELLRQYFPGQNASTQPHRLWVVLDAAGNMQLSGEMTAEAQLDDLAPRIRSETGREPGSWRVETVTNAQGQLVELAVMRLPR